MSAARIVVIGGGYAGTMAANRLTRHEGLDITVINPRPRFVERIRLHQQVAGSRDAALAYDTVLSKRVRLLVDTVERIDPVQRSLHLASGNQVPYDYLIYAAGSTGSTANVPGAQEFAYSIATLEEAERLGLALRAAPIEAAVTVVGGGPTGIETAAELSERGHLVTLVSAQFGPSLHPRARRRVARQLQRLGVQVLDRAAVTAVQSEAVELADGRRLRSDVTIWTAGFGVSDLAARSGLRTDGLGRLVSDETLSSVDDARIVAAGDGAAPSAMPYRMSCQAAMQMGPLAAETVLARVAGRTPEPVALGFFALCLSLGRKAGVVQAVRRDDTAGRFHVGGGIGAAIKELICRGTITQLRYEARWPGLLQMPRWAKDNRRHTSLAASGARAGRG